MAENGVANEGSLIDYGEEDEEEGGAAPAATHQSIPTTLAEAGSTQHFPHTGTVETGSVASYSLPTGANGENDGTYNGVDTMPINSPHDN